ncbi:MAG: heat-inducible transcription repressor HrcA, partial [Rhodospirillales bacterium]|nr:heat-inducible transcription repressor HrcA [Rhodospirillales bacterium]
MDHRPKPAPPRLPPGLDIRSAAVLREIVEQYVETGEPVGSRTLSRLLPQQLSPATIRNVMADLTDAGLLFSPHTSAGRLPTERGLRLFVDGLLQFGELSEEERAHINLALARSGRSMQDTMREASSLLSGLSSAAGLVLAPKGDGPVKHIEFVPLSPGRALVVLVSADGQVENRIIETPLGLPPSALQQASNFLNAQLSGLTLPELRRRVDAELAADRSALDELTSAVIATGLATWGQDGRAGSLILRGQGRLLEDIDQLEKLSAIQALFERLETE